MIGRAGRTGLGDRGESFLMCKPQDAQKVYIVMTLVTQLNAIYFVSSVKIFKMNVYVQLLIVLTSHLGFTIVLYPTIHDTAPSLVSVNVNSNITLQFKSVF